MYELKVGDIVRSRENMDYKGNYTIISIDGDRCTIKVNGELPAKFRTAPTRYEGVPLDILYRDIKYMIVHRLKIIIRKA